MNKAIPFVALLFSSAAFANSSGSSASATGAVYQSTQQNNLIGEVIHPYGTVGSNYASCATDSLSIGVVGNYNDSFGSVHSHGASLGVSYNIPIGSNGVNDRCKQQQDLLIMEKRIQVSKANQEDTLMALEVEKQTFIFCMEVEKAGIRLDHLNPMAGKCSYYHNVEHLAAFQK